MKMMDRSSITVISLIAIASLLLLGYMVNRGEKFAAECQAAGGVAKIGRDLHLCIKTDAIIEIETR